MVITGDPALSGGAEDYALGRDRLERQLWPARERLLLVPGNHDVDRGTVKRTARAIQIDLLQSASQAAIAEVVADVDDRATLLKRHADYLAFCSAWLGQDHSLSWWQRTLEIHDQRLHIAGLDLAWMAHGDTDRGELLFGRWQLKETVDVADAADADWRLAPLHHPWDYLAEFDSCEAPARLPPASRPDPAPAPAGRAFAEPDQPKARHISRYATRLRAG